jgi:hypothetical protein
MRLVSIAAAVALLAVAPVVTQQTQPAGQAAQLRIVVIEGEDAVNIVQQRTAVRPIVEVRDRNDLPVAGATVQFLIQRGAGAANSAAFAGNQSAVTITTDAAGRAVSSPLQAVGQGAVRIEVQASYQGQVATTTVNQTNFATAADAAQAGRTPSQSGAAATSGTLGATAGLIAGIAAAGIGGALAIKEATGEKCSGSADEALANISAAVATCTGVPASSPVCAGPARQASVSLGSWCTCDGRANVDAALRREGTSLDQLTQGAALSSVEFPAACR